jgi:hypothetical protein
MGLDIYLYKYDNYEEVKRVREEVDRLTEAVYEDPSIPEGDEGSKLRMAKCRTIEQEHGYVEEKVTDTWSSFRPSGEHKIELKSQKYPDHLFSIGYFRSSYNDSGINRVLSEHCNGRSLDWIFPHGDEYEFQPDWTLARERTTELLNLLSTAEHVRVMKASHNQFISPDKWVDSTEAALKLYKDEQSKHVKRGDQAFGGNYGNLHGEFYLDEPLEVVAVIAGREDRLFGLKDGEIPCHFLVYKSKHFDSYLQSLGIVIETCDYVLAQPDPEKYWLHWSG